jgi:shikimate kinase
MRGDKTNIVLFGFMGSGKTTVAGILAGLTGREAMDTDALAERREGRPITDIFARAGEEGFRDLERRIIGGLSEREGLVIAAGGGSVLDRRNVDALRKNGILYHLEVSPGEVLKRVKADGSRPLLPDEGLSGVRRLMLEREEAYAYASDVTIETDGLGPEEVARAVLNDFLGRGKGETD